MMRIKQKYAEEVTHMEEQMHLGNGMFAIYKCVEKRFVCSAALWEAFGRAGTDPGNLLCETIEGCVGLNQEERQRLENILTGMSTLGEPTVYQTRFLLRDKEGHQVPYNVGFVCDEPKEQIVITLRKDNLSAADQPSEEMVSRLTGLMKREAFLEKLSTVDSAGSAVVYFDVQRFKVINNMFGMMEGDSLLCHIADRIREAVGERGFGCQLDADRFVFYIKGGKKEVEQCVETLFDEISTYGLPFEILCNAGIYMSDGKEPLSGAALDCAIMAQNQVKGSFTRRFNYYSDALRVSLLGEHEIVGMMRTALRGRQFLVYYQPQYNHSTGMLVGAEALVRWLHPEKGLISPAQFIPVFERNGFITQLDQYVFEEVCVFLQKRLEQKVPVVPISVNLTRYDLFAPGFLDGLEAIRQKHNVPVKYVRIEITESSAQGNSLLFNEALSVLHRYGYIVEMDDFGSGYSSLNILKDIDFDMIKMDMNFFKEQDGQTGRGGTILSSVVRMVNWLQLPLIAEGVETVEQADFLSSIGCDYIQGYLYAKPMPEEEYDKLLRGSHTGVAAPNMHLIETMDASRFWSNDSLETLIFSNYVGGAAIFDYSKGGSAEILRVNKKYLQELGMNLSERDLVYQDILGFLDEKDAEVFRKTLDKAIETGEEQECETWRRLSSSCCGEDHICIRSTMRVVGRSKGNYIFYAMIRNITAEKQRYTQILDSERRFKAASEQINIYYWEYTVATHEMRPCFRCMRDLGMPALLTNYPDSAIEMGVFPPEVADLYRDWHRQIDAGIPSLEAVLPLTVGRIPFHVRYTTEFDESGHPIKAYGSAALVVD